MRLVMGVGARYAEVLRARLGEPKSIHEAYKMLQTILSELPEATRQDVVCQPWKIIPRMLIDQVRDDLTKILGDVKWEIAGSYRRELPFSGDIDLIVEGERSEVMEMLKGADSNMTTSWVTKPYAEGDDRVGMMIYFPQYMIYVMCDIFFTTHDEYPFMLFYATGSKEFNIRMRRLAMKMGGKLNQRELVIKNKKCHAESEEDILKILGLPYILPKDR